MTLEELKKSGAKITKISQAYFPRQCKKEESIVQELVGVLNGVWKSTLKQEKKHMFVLDTVAREYLTEKYGNRYEPMHVSYFNKNGEEIDLVNYELLDNEKIDRKIVKFTFKTIRMTAWVLENDEIMGIRTINMKPHHINNKTIFYPKSFSDVINEIIKLIKEEINDLTNDYKGDCLEIKRQQEYLKNYKTTIEKHKDFIKRIKQNGNNKN